MRLISQTGDIDVPYESSAIARADGLIVAYSVNYDSKRIVMGMYSTEEKAKKVIYWSILFAEHRIFRR